MRVGVRFGCLSCRPFNGAWNLWQEAKPGCTCCVSPSDVLSKVFKYISLSFSLIGQYRLEFLANCTTCWMIRDCINLYLQILVTVVESLLQYGILYKLSKFLPDDPAYRSSFSQLAKSPCFPFLLVTRIGEEPG